MRRGGPGGNSAAMVAASQVNATGQSTHVDTVTFTAVAGRTYYIVVEDFENSGVTYNLSFQDTTGGCR